MDPKIPQKIASFFTAQSLRTFARGELLIRPQEPLPGVFYLTAGNVSQYDITPVGNEVVVNVFKPGAFFPMSVALNGTSNDYFFEASTAVTAHVASPAAAVRFLHDNPDVTFDLLQRVYKGVDGVLRRMAHLMGGDAKHRLLFEILNAAYRFGEANQDGSVYISISESELGRRSGLARETVSRNMAILKTAGLIKIGHGGLVVTDVKRLEALLGSAV